MAFDKDFAMRMIEGLFDANLSRIARAADMARFQFTYGIDTNPFMHLHIQSSYRLVSPDKTIVLASSDVFQPNSDHEVNQDFDFIDFEWDVFGKNRFDEVVQNNLLPRLNDFVVDAVDLSDLGDLKVGFTNGYYLEIYLDTSGEEECWRYLNTQDADIYLIVTGVGIEK